MKAAERPLRDPTSRLSAAAGVSGALLTFVFGILHPKGTSDVGSLSEWMTRVGGSDIWVLIHFMLLWASVLMLIALVGIARSYNEEPAATWARYGMVAAVLTTVVAVMTFLIDGAVVKEIADRWVANPADPANQGAARLATELGFILIAGLQVTTGTTAFLFAMAGLRSRVDRAWPTWLAFLTAGVGVVAGSASYLLGESTWSVSATYVSSALFGIWVLAMSLRLRRRDTTSGAGLESHSAA